MFARRSHRSFLAVLGLLPGLGLPAQMVVYHDQTSAQHQSRFDTLSAQGYRMLSLSMYDSPSNPRYAAVWVQRSGPAWIGFHAITSASYQGMFNTWTAQGYAPKLLTAIGSGASIRISGIFERDATPMVAVHDASQAAFDWQYVEAAKQNYVLTSATVYGTAAAPLYAAVWQRNDRRVGIGYSHATDANQFQLQFDAWTQRPVRPVQISVSSWGSYFSLWHDNQLPGNFVVGHALTSAGFQAMFDAQSAAGYYPISVHGGGSGAATRFAAVFVSSESIVGRTFTTTGTAVPPLAAFDSYVRAMMQADNIRAASLAVVKDGRLMLARGYTWAEPGFTVTQPTSLFRIASAAKSLTSIGIHRAMERDPRSIHDLRSMLSFFPAISPLDARTRDVKLVDLLTHRGGWNSDIAGDPLFADEAVAAFHGNQVPVTKDEIYRYMTLSQPLQFTPGSSEVYSNYGFTMLGKVLEELNPGLTYETVIRRDVFSPLGVVRPKIGGSTFSQIGSDEVPYDPLYPGIWRSVAHSIRPWVPVGYGTWNQRNLDSCGGWVMATCDYAAVLAALSLGDQCPILGSAYIDHMWSPNSPSKPGTLRGWWESPVVSHGQSMVFRSHNGGLAGSGTLCALRSDGFGFCLFLNQNRFAGLGVPEMNDLSLLADLVQQWPNHDLFPSVSIPSLRTRVRGFFLPYGAGCVGSAGTPIHSGRGEPEVGQPHQLEVASAPSGTPFVAMLGASRSEWNGIGLPLPLASIGAPGCSLLAAPTLTFGGVTGRTGVGAVTVSLPDNPVFLGAHLFTQMAVVDVGANPLGLTFSNGIDALVGGWR